MNLIMHRSYHTIKGVMMYIDILFSYIQADNVQVDALKRNF